MFYRTIFLAAGLLATASLSAQGFSMGVKAGYLLNDPRIGSNSATFVPEFGSFAGFHAGLESRVDFGNRFALLTELQYARKGYLSTLAWPTGIAEARYELHYLTLPVLIDYRIWRGLSVQAGAEVGYQLDARTKSAGANFDPELITDLYNDFDLGLAAGLEYRFCAGFFVTARYTYGLVPFLSTEITNSNGEPLEDVNAYNRTAQFSAGYRYHFSKK